jgi:hypothetical protein
VTALRLLVLGWLAAAGCVLLDDRQLELRPAGVLFAGEGGATDARGRPVVEFEVRSAATMVEVELDGVVQGTRPANRRVTFDPTGLRPGQHLFTVRELDAARPKHASRTLAWYPFLPRMSWVSPSPPEAPLDTTTVRLAWEQPLVSEAVTPAHAWLEADGVRLDATPRLEGDGRVLALDLPAPLGSYGEVVAHATVGLFGSPGTSGVTIAWKGSLVEARIARTTGTSDLVSGAVGLGVYATQDPRFSPQIELLAGERVVATFDATGTPWNATWDTTQVPDGDYPLSLRVAPGFRVRYTAPSPTLTVLNASVGVTSCARAPGPFSPLGHDCFTATLSSAGEITGTTFLVAGHILPVSTLAGVLCPDVGQYHSPWEPLTPPLFEPTDMDGTAVLQVTTRSPTGVAGGGSCVVAFPPWTAAAGDPLPGLEATGSVALAPDGQTCLFTPLSCVDGQGGVVVAIGRSGAEAGKVRGWVRVGAEWTPSAILNREPGSVASGLAGFYWIERTGSGPGHAYSADWAQPLNLDPARDASALGVALGEYWTLTSPTYAWSEEAAPAGRVVVVLRDELPRLHPEAVATAPAVMRPQVLFGPEPYFATFAAWTEAPPGGVARVRAATVPGTEPVVPFDGVDNEDPGIDAAEPTVFAATGVAAVAWREGGRILARVITSQGVGPAVALNADLSRAARSPRFDGSGRTPTLYWLEAQGDGGEAIRVRRYTGSEWLLYPQPVNGPTPGRVDSFTVESHRVAWVDGEGKVHLRVANFER